MADNYALAGSIYPLKLDSHATCPVCWGSKVKAGTRAKCPHCSGTGIVLDWQLSKHFKLSEMLKSDYAIRKGIPNLPAVPQVHNLSKLCIELLDPIREKFGPVKVNSGFRSAALNKAIGGSASSAHMEGNAADIVPMTVGVTLRQVMLGVTGEFDWGIASGYDQIIYEGTWIHIGSSSAGAKRRKQNLMMFPVNGKPKYYAFSASDPRVI